MFFPVKTQIQKITSMFLGVLCLCVSTHVVNASNPPMAVKKAADTIAGYSTFLESSYGTLETDVTFRVQKPDGSVFEIPTETNEVGIANVDFLGFHTRRSGTYRASIYYWDYDEERPALTDFQVYPDVVSPSRSRVSVNKSAIQADGEEIVILTVAILDQYGNPIPEHRLTVVSSRPQDVVSETDPHMGTNEYGQKTFEISCRAAGVSFLSVLDQSTGIILKERAKLICFEPEEEETIGGSFLQANIFGGDEDNTSTNTGPIAKFELEFTGQNNQPNVAIIGSDQNYFRITAQDSNGNTIKNYTGSVLMEVPNDPNAVLPNNGEYTFSPRDEGSFEFSLAFQFSQVGPQDIRIFAYDPDTGEIFSNIRGETVVNILESEDVDPEIIHPPSEKRIEIKTPTEGNKYASHEISITGKGPENADLRIMLNGVEASTIGTDSDGVFFSTLSNITDGVHQLYLQNTIGDRYFSNTISFSIDTTPPIFEEIQLYPAESVEAGKVLTVTVISEAGLKNVTIRLDDQEYTLPENENKWGNYERSLEAPMIPGDYSLDVILTDTLGNKSKFSAQEMLTVVKSASSIPPTPQNLQATPQEEAVALTWEKVVDHSENVVLYVLYLGESELSFKETQTVAANETTAIISGLEAGKEYFFAVAAVDINGKESLKSNPVTVRPLFPENTHSAGLQVKAETGDGFVRISWEASQKNPDMYIVRYGIRSGQYVEEVAVSRLRQSKTLADLINDVPYYFTVQPYGEGVSTGEQYAEISATPQFGGVHPAPQAPLNINVPAHPNSGPETALVFIGFSFLLMAFIFFARHRLVRTTQFRQW